MRNKIALRTFLFTSASVLMVASAGAALADDAGVETVTVTAERRSEPLFDVPATITAISGQDLKDMGYTDMKSVVQMVPNAVLPDDPENFETYINIRGVHQADINAEPNFGLYRNGMFAGGERANLGAQIDIDRIEVLSGPQSGLYGRDAVGGVVNVIYKTAQLGDMNGYALASYGRWQRSQLEGAVNLPVTDNFAVRLTGWWINQNEGQLYNDYLHEYIDFDRDLGGRISGLWQPLNNLSITWLGEFQDKHGPSFEGFIPKTFGAAFGVNCCGLLTQPPQTMTTIMNDTPSTEHWQQLFVSQDVNYDTKSWAGTVELMSAYRDYHLALQEDWDHTAIAPAAGPMVTQQIQYRNEGMHNFYSELIWKSPDDRALLAWLSGADYFSKSFRFTRIFAGSIDFNLLNAPAFGAGYTYGNLLCSFLMPGNDGNYDGGCDGNSATGLPGSARRAPGRQISLHIPEYRRSEFRKRLWGPRVAVSARNPTQALDRRPITSTTRSASASTFAGTRHASPSPISRGLWPATARRLSVRPTLTRCSPVFSFRTRRSRRIPMTISLQA